MFNFFRRNTKKESAINDDSIPERVSSIASVTTSQKDNNKRPNVTGDVVRCSATVPTQVADAVRTENDVDKNSLSDGCAPAAHVPGEITMAPMAASRGKGKGKRKAPPHHNTSQNTENTANTVQQQQVKSNSYANILKRLDSVAMPEPDKTKPTHSVKPCSHVTIAAPPRDQPPLKTLPDSPTVTPRTKKTPSEVVASENTVRGTIQLRIDLPSAALTAVTTGNNNETNANQQLSNNNNNGIISGQINNINSEGVNSTDNIRIVEGEKKNLVNQETKFKSQLTELTERLQARDTETSQLKYQVQDLQRDVYVKSSAMERLQAELQAAYKDSEFVRQKLKHLQDEVHVFKQKNVELGTEIQKKTDDFKSLEENGKMRSSQLECSMAELTEKLQQLETQLGNIQEERDRLQTQRTTLEIEREEEKRIVQEALDAAMEEKEAIKKRWEEDFEKLRTVNTDREQQMLDDFEWKLREVQQMCKRRLDEKEKQAEILIKQVQKDVDSKLGQAEQQMKEVVHLKSYEAEVSQLRGLTHDQQHSLRTMSTRVEELQLAEQNLNDDIGRLQAAVEIEKQKQEALARKHEKDLADRERSLQIRLEKQRGEVAVQWEQKLRQECARLKTELEQMHGEEKHLAVELVKVQKDREFEDVRVKWEHAIQKHVKQISELKVTLNKNDDKHATELERLQTNTDRDIMELRRELDRVEMSYHERIEKMVDEHEGELEKLNEEADRRIKEMEQNCQIQMSSMRATLELVKEQMERETQDRLQHLLNNHERALDEERDRLTLEKNEQVDQIEHGYKCKFDMLKEKFTTVQKSHQFKETELLQLIAGLKQEMSDKKSTIEDLQANVDTLHGGVQVLNQEISNQDQKFSKVKADADTKIGELQHALKVQRDTLQVEREEHIEEISHVQKQSQAVIEQLQRKCQCLTKLFEEMRSRYDKRESRTEDLTMLKNLRTVVTEQEKSLAILNEQKRYFEIELMRQTAGEMNTATCKTVNGVTIVDDSKTDMPS